MPKREWRQLRQTQFVSTWLGPGYFTRLWSPRRSLGVRAGVAGIASRMTFTEHSSQSWGSRLLESIKSVLIGLVLFVVAFPLLFWNEGRAVHTAKCLAEGSSQ